jgi:hypothetical protein
MHDRQTLTLRWFQQLDNVAHCVGRLAIGRGEQPECLVEWIVQCVVAGAPPKVIRQLVACDSVNPGGQRRPDAIRMSSVVNCQQDFVHEILDIGRTIVKPPPQEATKVRAQFREKLPVSGAIAVPAAKEQARRCDSFACAAVISIVRFI